MNAHRTYLMLISTALVICQAPLLFADETVAWTARASANVNLRAAPGLHGAVITGLTKGTELRVLDQAQGWVKVSHQNDTFGYQGWVYGHYVQRVDDPAVEAAAAKATEIHGPTAAEATTVPSGPPAGPDTAGRQTAIRTAPAIPLPGDDAPNTPGAMKIPLKLPEKAILAEPGHVNADSTFETTESDRGSAFSQDVPETQPLAKPVLTSPARQADTAGMMTWLSLVLRLGTVLMASMALFMANRALQTAREADYRPTRR